LRIPLPPDHDYAVFKGVASGEGELAIFNNDPGAYDLTVRLSQITFVYLLCMALVAHLSGVLTTLKKVCGARIFAGHSEPRVPVRLGRSGSVCGMAGCCAGLLRGGGWIFATRRSFGGCACGLDCRWRSPSRFLIRDLKGF
jgi:hypothetical protein